MISSSFSFSHHIPNKSNVYKNYVSEIGFPEVCSIHIQRCLYQVIVLVNSVPGRQPRVHTTSFFTNSIKQCWILPVPDCCNSYTATCLSIRSHIYHRLSLLFTNREDQKHMVYCCQYFWQLIFIFTDN